jgi:hypothetical protein
LRAAIVSLLLVGFGLGCASAAWERARDEDTAAAYHRYLSEYADSAYARDARARLALVRLRSKPTAEAWDAFRSEFPDDDLLAELRPSVAPIVFARARAVGTPSAYREFLEEFDDGGELAERARGNLEFLDARGWDGKPAELAAFAERHPTSDFAQEAQRSAEAVALRSQSAIRTLGLVVEIAPGAPNPERLVRVFSERALARYAEAGIVLVPLSGARDPRAASLPVRLTIRHQEELLRTDYAAERGSASGVLATTRVTLTRAGVAAPIWSDEFKFLAAGATHGADSIIFGAGSQSYWSAFFVPVATWQTNAAVRPARELAKPIASLAISGSRAIVLFTDGDLELFDLGDPAQPILLGAHRRKRDLSRWSGLHLAGDRVVLFGPDGIEMLELREGRFVPVLALDRGTVGTIVAVESLGHEIVAAGSRGLALIDGQKGQRELLFERPVLGLARAGEQLMFTDGESLFISTRALLRERRVQAELRLGRGFGPGALHLDEGQLVVVAQRGVAVIDVATPGRPQLVSRIDANAAGEIRDAARVGGRLFLLGQRGLQLTDPRGAQVVDAAWVSARQRVARSGRHLVMVGEKSLQVVDTTPFVSGPALAAPLP